MFENKNVLVTGGTGMIGRELVSLLVDRGAKVFICSLDQPKDIPKGVSFVFKDLRYLSNCFEVCKGMDYVFNCAGVKGSPKMCMEQPADFFVPMIQFNTNMMQAAFESDVEWYLYTSSVGVYHPAEVFKEDDVWITMPSKNDWFAGWAKRMGELQAKAYSIQHNWDKVSIVRPANVYGSYDNFDPDNAMVIPALIRKAFENDSLSVWGDGSPIRDFIHARDVALGMIHMVENKVTKPVNLGSGEGIKIKRIAEAIANYFDKEIEWDISKPTGDARRVFDMTRAKSCGFEPSVSIEDGINETIEWFLENKENIDKRFNAFK